MAMLLKLSNYILSAKLNINYSDTLHGYFYKNFFFLLGLILSSNEI